MFSVVITLNALCKILGEDIVPDKNYQCTKDSVKFLGIMISMNKNELFKLNFKTQLTKLKTVLDIWSQRDLTPIGKSTIVKSLALS